MNPGELKAALSEHETEIMAVCQEVAAMEVDTRCPWFADLPAGLKSAVMTERAKKAILAIPGISLLRPPRADMRLTLSDGQAFSMRVHRARWRKPGPVDIQKLKPQLNGINVGANGPDMIILWVFEAGMQGVHVWAVVPFSDLVGQTGTQLSTYPDLDGKRWRAVYSLRDGGVESLAHLSPDPIDPNIDLGLSDDIAASSID